MQTQILAISIPEFAARLGVKPPTIRKWLMVRKISFAKIGRRVVIPVSELDRLIEQNLIPALPERDAR